MDLHYLDQHLRLGRVTLHAPDGRTRAYGRGQPRVAWYVHRARALRRLPRDPIGVLGDTYVRGDWDTGPGQLASFVDILVRNLPPAALGRRGVLRRAREAWDQWRHGVPDARATVDDDAGEWLARHILDRERHTGCAYFFEPGVSLEEAQRAQCRRLATKLCLRPGLHVLDLNCGWGTLALYLARHGGVRVTGLTRSRRQLLSARRRARDEGLADRVRFELQDVASHEGHYDRVVAVEPALAGAAGVRRLHAATRRLLDIDGVAVIQFAGRFRGAPRAEAWSRRRVAPWCYRPALSQTVDAVERAGLMVADLEVLRRHESMTARAWLDRLEKNRAEVARRLGEPACRRQEYHLALAAAGWRDTAVFQLQLARHQDAVPMTRRYLHSPWEALALAQDPDLPEFVSGAPRNDG